MLKSLQTAIMTRYNSVDGATLRGLVQGLYEDEAPSSVALQTQAGENLPNVEIKPIVVFSIVTTGLDDQNFCSDFFSPLVQFVIYGDANNKSSIDLLTICKELISLYANELLTMDDGYEMIRVDTVEQRKFKDIDKMWNVIVEMQYIVQKDR